MAAEASKSQAIEKKKKDDQEKQLQNKLDQMSDSERRNL
jgi:hypothetical protein